MKRIGYWSDLERAIDITLPYPEQFVDQRWNIAERIRVAHYLRDGIVLTTHELVARCIMGCKSQAGLGSADFTDGVWQWPEGYAHYIEAHAVKPTSDFLEHIRRNRYHVPRKEEEK